MNWMKNLATFGLVMAASSFATQYEAESATLDNSAVKEDAEKAAVVTDANASGGSVVNMNKGNIEFRVNADAAGKFLVKIKYKAGDEKINYLTVNGAQVGEITFPAVTEYAEATTTATLKAGENTIGLKHFWGYISVDYIDVTPYESQAFSICNKPITPGATPEAVALYNFLVNNFGKKTISGIMTGSMDEYTAGADFKTHPDVADIYARSGKYPALVGTDFLFANGPSANGSWNKQYTEKALSLAKDLWSKGGIPAFTWHWKDPADSVDAFYATQAAAGEGKDYTTFDFTEAFMTGTTTWDTLSTAYKGIIDDIDHIADYFLELQEAKVAAIFRPLHESGGTWFWWSTRSGKQFAALYRLVYERMVFTKGVKNLVWVFNPSSTSLLEWNPGETYYDVLSIDIYNDDNNHSSNSAAFDDFKTKWGVSKILALTENGPIPDIENMVADEAIWSWWMPWYSTWDGKWPGQTSNVVWKKNMDDERIITFEDMKGWSNYTDANIGTGTCEVAKATSQFNGDAEKAAGNKKEDKMTVAYKLGEDGALINYTNLPDLTGITKISVDINVDGSGNADGGVWFGLAIVRNGMEDEAWTWEQSPSDGCWIDQKGGSKTCTFDMTSYTDKAGVKHDMDIDNAFSIVIVASAAGFTGTATFDNMIADNGTIISTFDESKTLFAVSEGSETSAAVYLASEYKPGTTPTTNPTNSGDKQAIKGVTAAASKLTVAGNRVMLSAATAGQVSVDVFSMSGKRVATLFRGALAAGSHSFDMSDLSKGQYIVRVKGAGLAATQPVRLK